VGHFPASENGMFESEGIQKFKEEKIFEIASERCVTTETEALRTRKKEISCRWWTQKKERNDKYSYTSLRDYVME
jgi:hypothetical protein